MNFEELKEGEYLVKGHLRIDFNPFQFHTEEDPIFLSFNMQELVVKTQVSDYNQANYHLLGVAERIRNYAAFFCKMRLPLDFYMIGKRPNLGFPFVPLPAIFNGSSKLPFSDGGYNDVSIFRTRFGPHDGLKPPYEAIQTYEKLSEWSEKIHNDLKLTQSILEKIESTTFIDIAISSLGKSRWMEGVEERLGYCWKSLESISKIDYPKKKRTPFNQIFKSIHKRLNTDLTMEQFNLYRKYRNLSTHEIPSPESFIEIHQTAGMLYTLASKIVESELKDRNLLRDNS